MRLICIGLSVTLSVLLNGISPVAAAEKAYYGTVISVDSKANSMKIISTDGAMIKVVVNGQAAKHLGKIPLNTLIDLTVDVQPNGKRVVKTWKMVQAKSPCRVFDGKKCSP